MNNNMDRMSIKERLLVEWNDSKWFIGLVVVSMLILVRMAYVG